MSSTKRNTYEITILRPDGTKATYQTKYPDVHAACTEVIQALDNDKLLWHGRLFEIKLITNKTT